MSLRVPELNDPTVAESIRKFFREFGLSIEQELDHVEDLINTETNTATISTASTSANYSAGNRSVIFVDSTSGVATVTLPNPASRNRTIYVIKKTSVDANDVNIVSDGGALIEGVATYTLSGGDSFPSAYLVSDGSQYWVI